MARKSSDNVTYVKNVVKIRHSVTGSNLQRCQKQNYSDTNVSSVGKNGAQHNFSHPVAQPMASSVNGNDSVRDEQISGVEQAHVEANHFAVLGPCLNLIGVQDSDPNDPSGHGLNPYKQN